MGVVQSGETVGQPINPALFESKRFPGELATTQDRLEKERCRTQTPKAQQILDQLLYLPIYPSMRQEQIERMGRVIVEFEAE